jgi:hypothetical protein
LPRGKSIRHAWRANEPSDPASNQLLGGAAIADCGEMQGWLSLAGILLSSESGGLGNGINYFVYMCLWNPEENQQPLDLGDL